MRGQKGVVIITSDQQELEKIKKQLAESNPCHEVLATATNLLEFREMLKSKVLREVSVALVGKSLADESKLGAATDLVVNGLKSYFITIIAVGADHSQSWADENVLAGTSQMSELSEIVTRDISWTLE